MSKLIIYYKNEKLIEFPITSMETKIGSGKSNNIRLLAMGIAEHQCKINKVDTSYILTDLTGDKRTMLNSQPALADKLQNDDRIRMSDFTIVCKLDLMESLVDVMLNQMTGTERRNRPGDRKFTTVKAGEIDRAITSECSCTVTRIDDRHVQIQLFDANQPTRHSDDGSAFFKSPWGLIIIGCALVAAIIVTIILTSMLSASG